MIINHYCQACLFSSHSDIVRIDSQSSSISHHVLNETDQLVLHCTATGLPPPSITWSKNVSHLNLQPTPSPHLPSSTIINTSPPIQDSNGVYTVTSTLILSLVMYSDRGTYICTALNSRASNGTLFSSNDTALFTIIIQSK